MDDTKRCEHWIISHKFIGPAKLHMSFKYTDEISYHVWIVQFHTALTMDYEIFYSAYVDNSGCIVYSTELLMSVWFSSTEVAAIESAHCVCNLMSCNSLCCFVLCNVWVCTTTSNISNVHLRVCNYNPSEIKSANKRIACIYSHIGNMNKHAHTLTYPDNQICNTKTIDVAYQVWVIHGGVVEAYFRVQIEEVLVGVKVLWTHTHPHSSCACVWV